MSFSQLSSFHAQLRSYLTGRPVVTFCDIIAREVASHNQDTKEATQKEGRMEDADALEASLNGRMDGSFGGSLTEFTSHTRAHLSLSGLQAAPPVRFVKICETDCCNYSVCYSTVAQICIIQNFSWSPFHFAVHKNVLSFHVNRSLDQLSGSQQC